MSLSGHGSPNRTVRLVFLEASLIVLGVVLAYGSTAWYESKKEKQTAEVALASILVELNENRSSVLSSIEYHAGIQRELVSAVRTASIPDRSAFSRGYFLPAEVLTTAWDLAHARGAIATLPHQEVLELSRAYFDQERYESTSRDVGGLIYGAIFQEGGESILRRYPNLLQIVMTVSYRECQLLIQYGEVLEVFGADFTPAPDTESVCEAMLNR